MAVTFREKQAKQLLKSSSVANFFLVRSSEDGRKKQRGGTERSGRIRRVGRVNGGEGSTMDKAKRELGEISEEVRAQ